MLPNNHAASKTFRTQHNKALKYVRKHLSRELFDLTKSMPQNLPRLLRYLRDRDNSNEDVDRDNMPADWEGLRLGQFSDMESYIQTFKQSYHRMRKLKMGVVMDDRDVLYTFHKTMPKAWHDYKACGTG